MCMAYYQGHGYSEEFNAHMSALLHRFQTESVVLRLTVGGDAVCAACPNLSEGRCTSCGRVEQYDKSVLELCGLEENRALDSDAFFSLVRKRILHAGKRPEICGVCQWNGLCQGTPAVIGRDFSEKTEKPY